MKKNILYFNHFMPLLIGVLLLGSFTLHAQSITLAKTSNNASVCLLWTSSSTYSSYEVYRDTDSNPSGRTRIAITSATNYTDNSVTNGTNYYYWIKATNNDGSTINSNSVQASPSSISISGITLSQTASDTQVNLTWTTNNISSSYQVYRDTDSDPSGRTRIAITTPAGYTDNSVSNGTTYYYWIKATDIYGNTVNSNSVQARPSDTSVGEISLSQTADNSKINLSWISNNISSSYQVYRDTDSNPSGRTRIEITSSCNYTDYNVTNGTSYYYWIKATDNGGNTINSNSVQASPSSIILSGASGDSLVNLSWTSSNPSSTYEVYRDTDSNPTGRTRIKITSSTNYTDNSVTNGTTYYYWIKVTSTNGTIVNSNSVEASPSEPSVYFIATNGSDMNSGTSTSSPFATLQKANNTVKAGDVVYIRGGQYNITNNHLSYVDIRGNSTCEKDEKTLYACGTKLTKSGAANALIKYYNYKNETPVFNYSNVTKQLRITGIFVTASYIALKGIEIINVPVNLAITDNTQSECIRNFGSNNTYEHLVMHDSEAIGFYLTKGSNNLVYNCDAYNIWDKTSGEKYVENSTDKIGGNSDGFGAHPTTGGTGNVFKNCRAWFCADDGFDSINAFEAVTFEGCWAFYNGYSSNYVPLADGNGFKSGGYGKETNKLPDVTPNHITKRCLAVGNRAAGFYANHHPGPTTWYNNTAYNNGVNYNMLGGFFSESNGKYKYVITDIDGNEVTLNNNISHYSLNANDDIPNSGQAVIELDSEASNDGYNTFTMNKVSVSDSDFKSLDLSQLTAARLLPTGDLPKISCLHLKSNSDLVDAGIPVKDISYQGTAPDLGCFESDSNSSKSILPLSKTDSSKSGFQLYPNPSSNYLNISLFNETQEDTYIRIVTMQGKVVFKQIKAYSDLSTIDISSMNPGIYIVQVIKPQEVLSEIFIKK